MDDFEAITESLRRQRRDLKASLDSTATRRDQTSEVLRKIEELRERAEKVKGLCLPAADVVPTE